MTVVCFDSTTRRSEATLEPRREPGLLQVQSLEHGADRPVVDEVGDHIVGGDMHDLLGARGLFVVVSLLVGVVQVFGGEECSERYDEALHGFQRRVTQMPADPESEVAEDRTDDRTEIAL